MSSIPSNLARVSLQLRSDTLLNNLRRTNLAMLRTQTELATGLKVNRPSDAPQSVSVINALRGVLDRQEQIDTNLQFAAGSIDNTDQALAEITELLLEAEGIATAQIGIGSDAETRASQAAIIDAQLTTLMQVVSRKFQDVHLFGGRAGGALPFVAQGDAVRYVGARDDLSADLGLLDTMGINTNGHDALGAMSSRVLGTVDLDPNATASTRIADVRGALNQGVALGTVAITVDGTNATVDLTGSDTLGDIVVRINDAINTIDPTAGALGIAGPGFELTANAGHTINIAEVGTGRTASDLGIVLSATGATVAGGDLDAKLAALTQLADLGVAVDLISGLNITNGSTAQVVDLSTAATVQDMMNAVNSAGLGVRMEINDGLRGLNLVNELSGAQMSVGEAAGGSTASDLGLRSFAGATLLSEFRFGLGVEIKTGEDDLRIMLHDATSFDVNLDGATTAQDVIAAIGTAATGAGLVLGVDFNVGLAANGNGLQLDDNTAGAAGFEVAAINGSFAAEHLGIAANVGAAGTIVGQDNATVRTESVFTHLMMLRDALLVSDDRLIRLAGVALHGDIDRVAGVRAEVGVRARRIQDEQFRNGNLDVQNQQLLSELRDTEYTEAISRFTQLEQQLQANLATAAQVLQMSLLDFLR